MSWPHRIFAGQFTDFELKLLRVFRAVADCGGFSAAEAEIGLTKSAISKHVSDLEIRLGVRLCERGRSGFALTEEGKVVYEAISQLLVSLEEFRSRINAFHSELIGEFYIGFIDTLVTNETAPLREILSDYSKANPAVRLNMMIGSASEIDRAVDERRLHIGVSVADERPSGALITPLAVERSLLYCGAGHEAFALSDADLTDERLAQYKLVQHGYSLAENRAFEEMGLKSAATSHQTEGVLFLVLAGTHLGFLPTHYAGAWEARGMIRPIRPAEIAKETKIVVKAHRASLANPMVRSFLSMVKASKPEAKARPPAGR
ncbi:LysR family transcriptional regulator [Nordella sp. HKS 07]|uniref:LysR family transcriptional regulator n=1 Tax=Nordella sp. HKS 07 TaxID=2712222 RepID=UPI0013E18D04|nr:LysR family transcriptional regulator [Nordella sp. HKS 07]QIG49769.1 LysR family transcriptional regulator [Nordella sp. HKS 07]